MYQDVYLDVKSTFLMKRFPSLKWILLALFLAVAQGDPAPSSDVNFSHVIFLKKKIPPFCSRQDETEVKTQGGEQPSRLWTHRAEDGVKCVFEGSPELEHTWGLRLNFS